VSIPRSNQVWAFPLTLSVTVLEAIQSLLWHFATPFLFPRCPYGVFEPLAFVIFPAESVVYILAVCVTHCFDALVRPTPGPSPPWQSSILSRFSFLHDVMVSLSSTQVIRDSCCHCQSFYSSLCSVLSALDTGGRVPIEPVRSSPHPPPPPEPDDCFYV